MRYLLAIGLAFAVLAAAGCSNGMGKGHRAETVQPPPPPPPPPPPRDTQSNGMGKGSQIESNGMGKGTESNGMGKGHAAEAMPPPPPPVTESNGMGKGKALRVACHVTAINRAQRSFRCRMHGHSLKFYMTGASELRRGNRAVSFRHLQVGQSVRVRYFRDTVRTVDRATILR